MKGFHYKIVKVFLLLVFAQAVVAQTDFDLSLGTPGDPLVFPSGGGVQTLTYTIANDINGMDEADGTTVNFFYSFEIFQVNVTSSDTNWTCSEITQQITCNYQTSFDAGTSSTLNFNFTPPLVDGFVNNAINATLTNVLGDPDPSNNNIITNMNFIAGGGTAEIDVTKSIVGGLTEVAQGGMLDYIVEVNNTGAGDAINVDLIDILPVGVSYNSHVVLGSNFSCSYVAPTVSCNASTLPNTASQDGVRITVVVDGAINSEVSNTATSTFSDSNSSDNTDNVLFNIIGSSDFSISKTVSGSDFTIGDAFTYVLSINSPTTSTVSPTDVLISDTLPVEVSYDSFLVGTLSGTTINCTHDGSATGGLFTCNTSGVPFPPGETATIDINVTAASASGNVDNSATVETAADADGTANNNNDSAMTVVINEPTTTITASKIASVAGVPVTQISYGQTFEYVLEVQNTGNNNAQNVVVTDTLPPEVSLVSTQSNGWSCSVGSDIDCVLDTLLTPGSTAQIVVEVIATSNTSINSITNTMEVNGDNTGPEVTTDKTVTLQSVQASLNLSQTPSPVDPNADADFSLLAVNTGTTDLNGLQINGQLPTGFTYNGFSGDAPWSCTENAGTVSCAYAGTFSSSTSTTVNLETTAPTPQANQSYSLDATLSANELSNDLTQSLTVAFRTSDVSVVMNSMPQQVAQGESFKHIIQINNSGNFDLVNVAAFYAAPEAVTVLAITGSDFICSNNLNIITCNNLQPLVVGNSTQIEIGLRVDDFVGLVGGSVSVNADGVNKTASTSTQIINNIENDLALTKTASVSQVGQNELFAYQFDVINLGSETQTAFSLTDQLPAGVVFQAATGNNWSCDGNNPLSCQFSGSLAAGGQTQLLIDVIAPSEIGIITNTANINLTQDENASNDTSSAVVNVVEGGTARADLAVVVEASNPGVLNTEQVSWRIEVSNAGPDEAENVIVSNTLPIGFVAGSVQVSNGAECTLLESSLMCEIATLAVNQSNEIILEGGFSSGFSGLVINTVEVQSDAIDNNPSNNSSTDQVTVTEVQNLNADLALELNTSNQQVQQGGVVDLSFTAKNLGPDRGINAKISGSLSGLIENVQLINTGGWMCQANNNGISCAYPGDLQVGMQAEISLRVQTQQVVQQSQPVLFNATIESDSMDSQPANNIIGFSNEVTRTPTEDEIFAIFQNSVGSAASDTVIQSIRNVSSYCARSFFMAIEGLCEEFIAGATPENGGAIINAMEELTPNEVVAQSNSAAEIISSQFRNVGSRLAQLRGGGGAGLSVAGLSGRYGNESIPIGMLSYLNQSEDQQAVSNINDFVSPWGFFVNGSISMGERDATGQELGFDFDTFGLTAGVDYRFSSTKVAGLALGYANFDSEIEGEAEMKSTGFTLTGYGSFYIKDNFYVDARISYGNPDFEQKRRINFAVDEIVIDRVAIGKTDSDQYSVAMSAGYHFNKNSWNITPNASLRYVRTTIDAFQESGAGGFNFAFGEQEVKSMVWSIGTSVSKAISLKNGVISPQFDINLSRETENDGGLLEARFIAAPDDEIFWIGTDEPDRTYGSAGVGLVFIAANGKQAYINYRSIFGLEGFTRGTINVGARFEF
ncbi:internalin, putative [hydrothermal vent metagenome]|uniref:Internalin, putative n=1 Tax=hydrothermal vent metagenome TaxID=652676 RepID=A0A3B0VUM0_9ZZZZ